MTAPRTLVINRGSARGDVLLLTPVLRALRRRDPSVRLVVQTGVPEVLAGNPDIDAAGHRIHEPGAQWIDLDLVYERKPLVHIVDAYAEASGVVVSSRRPVIPEDRGAEAAVSVLFGGRSKWVTFHTGPGPWPGRHWPDSSWEELASRFRADGWGVALVGAKRDISPQHDLDLRGRTTVAELAAIIRRSSLFVGIDSFPMHVASGTGTAGVGIFGATSPDLRLPGDPHFVGIQAPVHRVWCVGCHHRLAAPRTESGCFRGTPFCMSGITVSAVIEAADLAREALERGPRPVAV